MFGGRGKPPSEPPAGPPHKPSDPRVQKLLDDMEIIVNFIKVLDLPKFKSNLEDFGNLVPSSIKISANMLSQKEKADRDLQISNDLLKKSSEKTSQLETEIANIRRELRRRQIYIFILAIIFILTVLYLKGLIKIWTI